MDDQYPDEEEEGENKRGNAKDRHSKVLTSKGLRDRRVRLAVNTAIQFYDLQDRLGYDQPSKAAEWLLKAAASCIAVLPPMNTPFPDTPKQLSDDKRSSTGGSDQLGFDSAEVDLDGGGGDPNYSQQQVTKSSACSSTSETSKGCISLYYAMTDEALKAYKGERQGNEYLINLIDSPGHVDFSSEVTLLFVSLMVLLSWWTVLKACVSKQRLSSDKLSEKEFGLS